MEGIVIIPFNARGNRGTEDSRTSNWWRREPEAGPYISHLPEARPNTGLCPVLGQQPRWQDVFPQSLGLGQPLFTPWRKQLIQSSVKIIFQGLGHGFWTPTQAGRIFWPFEVGLGQSFPAQQVGAVLESSRTPQLLLPSAVPCKPPPRMVLVEMLSQDGRELRHCILLEQRRDLGAFPIPAGLGSEGARREATSVTAPCDGGSFYLGKELLGAAVYLDTVRIPTSLKGSPSCRVRLLTSTTTLKANTPRPGIPKLDLTQGPDTT